MRKFIILYWLNIALFFLVLYFDISPIANIINPLQTDFTANLVSFTLDKNQIIGHEIIINKHYKLIIEKACNGLIPYIFFLASIFAFPSTLRHKIKWSIIGYITITAINTFRIWLVTKLVLAQADNFSLAHDFIGNAILILTAIVLFILFIKTREKFI